MPDSFAVAAGISLLGSMFAGPAVAYGLDLLPHQRRRTATWLFIIGAVLVAVLADLLLRSALGDVFVYILGALPGVVTFLAFRTVLASALVSLAPMYFVIAALVRDRPTYAPELALDRAVPLEPAWMLVYGSLYIFAVVLPLCVVRGQDLARRSMRAYLLVMLVSYLGFLLYPTAAPRANDTVIGDTFADWSLRLIYSIDAPYNCFPSLHVAYSFVSALTCSRMHRGVGAAAVAWAALIGLSTLYTKQHYAVDVIVGTFIAYVAYALFLRSYPRDAVLEIDRRRAPLRALAVVAIYAVMVTGFWVAYQTQSLALDRAR